VGLAVVTSLMNSHLKSDLKSVLGDAELDEVLNNAAMLVKIPTDVRIRVLDVFTSGYGIQFKAIAGFAAAQLVVALLIWKRNQIFIEERK
jgi:predicted butyrate kinase (DUF1464 family)